MNMYETCSELIIVIYSGNDNNFKGLTTDLKITSMIWFCLFNGTPTPYGLFNAKI